jgi:hypothetical protein
MDLGAEYISLTHGVEVGVGVVGENFFEDIV